MNAVHLGKKHDSGSGSRHRLVKVIVASEHEKDLLLQNRTKLRD